MSHESFFLILKRKWGSLFLSALLAGSLAFFSLVFFSKHFKATTDFLVVQTGTSQSQDFYSMLKSSEYLGKVLSQSVGSEKFIGAVVETGGVDGNFLPNNPKDRLEKWEKMVKVENNPDVGSLHIEVFGDNDRDTLRVAQAVGQVLTEKNVLFRSGEEKSVEIRTLSGPIIEKNPSIERIVLATGAGAFFGFSLFMLFVLLKSEAKSRELFLEEALSQKTIESKIKPVTQSESEEKTPETQSSMPSSVAEEREPSATEATSTRERLIFEEK